MPLRVGSLQCTSAREPMSSSRTVHLTVAVHGMLIRTVKPITANRGPILVRGHSPEIRLWFGAGFLEVRLRSTRPRSRAGARRRPVAESAMAGELGRVTFQQSGLNRWQESQNFPVQNPFRFQRDSTLAKKTTKHLGPALRRSTPHTQSTILGDASVDRHDRTQNGRSKSG